MKFKLVSLFFIEKRDYGAHWSLLKSLIHMLYANKPNNKDTELHLRNIFSGKRIVYVGPEEDVGLWNTPFRKKHLGHVLKQMGMNVKALSPRKNIPELDRVFIEEADLYVEGLDSKMPFPDNSQDIAISMALYDKSYYERHNPGSDNHYNSVAQEYRRVLTDGGKLLLENIFLNQGLMTALENAGFTLQNINSTHGSSWLCTNNKPEGKAVAAEDISTRILEINDEKALFEAIGEIIHVEGKVVADIGSSSNWSPLQGMLEAGAVKGIGIDLLNRTAPEGIETLQADVTGPNSLQLQEVSVVVFNRSLGHIARGGQEDTLWEKMDRIDAALKKATEILIPGGWIVVRIKPPDNEFQIRTSEAYFEYLGGYRLIKIQKGPSDCILFAQKLNQNDDREIGTKEAREDGV